MVVNNVWHCVMMPQTYPGRSQNHGRIWTCQFSVFTGIPFTLLLLKGLPRDGEQTTVILYCVTVLCMGLVHVWAGMHTSGPTEVLAQTVGDQLGQCRSEQQLNFL